MFQPILLAWDGSAVSRRAFDGRLLLRGVPEKLIAHAAAPVLVVGEGERCTGAAP